MAWIAEITYLVVLTAIAVRRMGWLPGQAAEAAKAQSRVRAEVAEGLLGSLQTLMRDGEATVSQIRLLERTATGTLVERGAGVLAVRGGNDAWGLAVSPDSVYMAGPGRDNGLGIWDLRTGRQVARAPFPEALSALAWHPVRPLLRR